MESRGTHQSIWKATIPGMTFSPLSGDVEVDVAVVGAGITGLTTALILSQSGKRVAVVERDHVASGSTGTTSAHLTTMVDHTYSAIAKSAGAESARLVSESVVAAVDGIERIIRENGIDCGFSRMPGYYFAEEKEGVETVRREFEAAAKAGQHVTLVDQVPLPFPTVLGFRIENQALFHPIAYCNGLARTISRMGSVVYTGTPVTAIDDGEPCTITTLYGSIRAADVVIATHTPLGINPVQAKLEIERSYAVALRVPGPNVGGLFWNTHEPYEYIRPYITPEGMETLIVGGGDHETGMVTHPRAVEQIIEYAQRRFSFDAVLYHWSAQHYDPTDSLPLIGKSPFSSHSYIATGMSGDGLVLGTVAAMTIADLICGNGNQHAPVYTPSRLGLGGIEEFVRLNLKNTKDFLKDRFVQGKKPQELCPDEASVRDRLDPTSQYRDTEGNVHSRKATCPHMGCIVHWNGAEKSWDCPCHGSRFTIEGEVIEGPTLSGLRESH